jgi:hypothetical protein
VNCAPNQTQCNGTCVNTNIDKNNCGGCGIACTAAQVCQNGTCVP